MKERLKFFLPVFYTLGAIVTGLLATAARKSVDGDDLETGAILCCYIALALSVALWHLSEKFRSRLLSMITAGFSGMVLIFNIMPNLSLWNVGGDFDIWGAKWHGALNTIVAYFTPSGPFAAKGDTNLNDDMLILISSFCGICALVLVFSRAIAHTPAPREKKIDLGIIPPVFLVIAAVLQNIALSYDPAREMGYGLSDDTVPKTVGLVFSVLVAAFATFSLFKKKKVFDWITTIASGLVFIPAVMASLMNLYSIYAISGFGQFTRSFEDGWFTGSVFGNSFWNLRTLITPSEGVVITATDYYLAIFGIIAGVLGLVGAGLIFFRALGAVMPRMKPGIRPVGALWPVLVLLGGLAAGMFLEFGKYGTVIATFFLPITAMLLYMYGWSNDSRGGYAASFFLSGLHALLIVTGLITWFRPLDFWGASPLLDSVLLGPYTEMLFTPSGGYYVVDVIMSLTIFVSMLGIAWYSLGKFNSLPDPVVAETPEETK